MFLLSHFHLVFLLTTLALLPLGVILFNRSTTSRDSATNIEKISQKGALEQKRPNRSIVKTVLGTPFPTERLYYWHVSYFCYGLIPLFVWCEGARYDAWHECSFISLCMCGVNVSFCKKSFLNYRYKKRRGTWNMFLLLVVCQEFFIFVFRRPFPWKMVMPPKHFFFEKFKTHFLQKKLYWFLLSNAPFPSKWSCLPTNGFSQFSQKMLLSSKKLLVPSVHTACFQCAVEMWVNHSIFAVCVVGSYYVSKCANRIHTAK